MKRTIAYVLVAGVMTLVGNAHASIYLLDGKEITKGQAVKAAMSGKSVIKQDQVKWDDEKGSLRNVKKSELKTASK